jgi:hypothetical protein
MKRPLAPALLLTAIAVAYVADVRSARAAQDATEVARAQPLAFYSFSDLLTKAERIVVAEVGPTEAGAVALIVRETLKAPENDAKYVEPERLKRAADLLANDKAELPPLPARPKAPARLRAVVEQMRLPPEGTQGVFFLWDRAAGEAGAVPTYRIAHPQCIYDVELLEQIKAGVARPRSVADGRYLRDWDREMAARARLRQTNETLLKTKGGEAVMGLRLRALRPALSLRGDNSFAVTVRVENTRSRDQALYDGPASGFGVLLRPKNGEAGAGLVLRQPAAKMGTDRAVLSIADMTDFTTIQGDSFMAKELFFDAKEQPALRGVDGEFTVAVFLYSEQDGRGLELNMPVWTGTMVSDEVPLQFQKPRDMDKKAER